MPDSMTEETAEETNDDFNEFVDFSDDSEDDYDEGLDNELQDEKSTEEDDSDDESDNEDDSDLSSDDEAGDDSDDASDSDDDAGSGGEEGSDSDKSQNGLQEQNALLMEMLAKMQKELEPEVEKEERTDPFKSESFDAFKKVLDLDDNEAIVVAEFLKEMSADTTTTAVKNAMKLTPSVVQESVDQQKVISNAKKTFFKKNPKLVPIAGYVKTVANELAASNPTFSIKQILDKAAETTYNTFNIDPEVAKKEEPGKRKKPAFANTTGSRKQTKNKKSNSDIIEDLFD